MTSLHSILIRKNPTILALRFYHIGRASNIHSAINRGLRKSNGSAFRGKANPAPDDPREIYKRKHGIPDYVPPPRRKSFEPRRGKYNKPDEAGLTKGVHRGSPREFRGPPREFGGHKSSPGEYRGSTREQRNPPGEYAGHQRDYRGSPREQRGPGEYGGPRREFGGSSREQRGPPGEYRGSSREYGGPQREYGGPQREQRGPPGGYRGSSREYGGPQREYGSSSMEQRGPSKEYNGSSRDSRNSPSSERNSFEGYPRFRDSGSGKGSRPFDLREQMTQSLRQSMKDDMDREKNFNKDSKFDRSSSSNNTFIESRTPFSPVQRQFNSQEILPQDSGELNRKARRDIMFRTGPKAKEKELKRNLAKAARKLDSTRINSSLPSSEFIKSQIPTENDRYLADQDSNGSDRHASKNMPISIPYTTPASEFLYGTSVIEAALKSRREPRRKLYKLYIYRGENRQEANQDERLQKLAEANQVEVVHVQNDWIRVLDKMSAGRPHNGYILEASPLPRLPVTRLWDVTSRKDPEGNDQSGIEVEVDEQSREEEAINGTSNFVRTLKPLKKNPLVLLLDTIVDPGNLGGIIRTATFFGISAIAVSVRNSASFTPVVLKASAGASEIIPLMSVNSPVDFIFNSKKAGWKIYAAVAPSENQNASTNVSNKSISSDELAATCRLLDEPTILVLGGEGQGLRRSIRNKADVEVYIPGRQTLGIDSLNVTVAAGILCNAFLGETNKKGQSTNLEAKHQESESQISDDIPGTHQDQTSPSSEHVKLTEEEVLF
ncbi:hypothetical protein K3495_g8513 [Podosphaera aphanis]|nr:hypothetical protein K3495_g8513 [Podosphaera aphanis]